MRIAPAADVDAIDDKKKIKEIIVIDSKRAYNLCMSVCISLVICWIYSTTVRNLRGLGKTDVNVHWVICWIHPAVPYETCVAWGGTG
jgi:hypothetical protein